MTSDTVFDPGEMQEVTDDFLVEADELIASLDRNFVSLEFAPDDFDLLNQTFRSIHTIKGTSSFLGFDQITTLSHRMEDVLNKLRKAETKMQPGTMDVLLTALDQLKVLLDNVRNHTDKRPDLKGILARIQATIESDDSITDQTDPSTASEFDDDDSEVEAQTGGGDLNHAAGRSGSSKAAATIRVDVERLDCLMNMIGELVLSRNALVQSVTTLAQGRESDYELEGIKQAVKSFNFVTTELQTAVVRMRMQPIGKVFNRFPRQVRDLARSCGKQIRLVISGEGTELDRSVIEEIGDPLMHTIRNSCDHGLETPEERAVAGKPTQGSVHLSARREGSLIVITVVDDGRGFDVDAIKTKAVERGLASRDEVELMPDHEAFNFIFAPGFSTAPKVTDISGRGVGMDVVSTNIQKLNGVIELDSTKGVGSSITIKLPLTLAIIQGLLVRCDDDVLVLPLSSVHETVRTEDTAIFSVNQRPVFCLRDEIVPLLDLKAVVNADAAGFRASGRPYIVVVGLAERKLGLMVDRFLGQEDVMIKSLGEYLGATEGVAGATILGDGRIRLIVDMTGLFNLARRLGA